MYKFFTKMLVRTHHRTALHVHFYIEIHVFGIFIPIKLFESVFTQIYASIFVIVPLSKPRTGLPFLLFSLYFFHSQYLSYLLSLIHLSIFHFNLFIFHLLILVGYLLVRRAVYLNCCFQRHLKI